MDTKRTQAMTPADWLRRGQELLKQNKMLEARKCFETVLATRPNDYGLHLQLGEIARYMGDLSGAEQHLRKALSLKPDSLEVQTKLGLLAWRRFNDVEVVERLAPVCRTIPRDLNMATYLAESYAALGQEEVIPDLFEAALRAGADAKPELLLQIARQINIEPVCRRAFFLAAARVTEGPVSQHLSQRAVSDTPLEVADAPEPWKSLLALPLPQRISACMIVKNEAPSLGRLLTSIQRMVDEIIVVDTGSTDETVAIAESYGAKVYHFSWCDDFAAARNESLRHATGDWILIVDADHEVDLASQRILRRSLQKPLGEETTSTAYAVQLVEHFSDDPAIANKRADFVALFANRPFLRFVGALHERLADQRPSAPPLSYVARYDIIYHHYGYQNEVVARQGKRARNMRIILSELEQRPHDAYTRYNYAQELMAEKRYDEALEQVRICLQLHKTQKGTFTSTFVKNAYVIYATVLGRRHDFESLLTVCEEGLQYFPDCSDLLGRRGLALLAANKTEQAIAPLEAALNQHGAIGADRSNVAYSGSVSETLLAIAHWRLGNTDRCDHHLRRTLATAKDHQQAAGRLATFCGLLLGDPKASITLLARIGVRLELASGTPPKSTQ